MISYYRTYHYLLTRGGRTRCYRWFSTPAADPGDTQLDHELGRAPPGARVMMSGVVINKFIELPRDTVAAYTGTTIAYS